MTIVRGPLDFNKTAADPQELGLVELINLERDDTLAVWGVPPSQAGVSVSRGMGFHVRQRSGIRSVRIRARPPRSAGSSASQS